DRVQCAITKQLQPEFAFDIAGHPARNTRANEKICQLRCSFGRRSDDEITTCEMFHATGFGHRYRDVNDGWHRHHIPRSADLIRIIDAVLQTNYCGIWPNEWSHLCRGR